MRARVGIGLMPSVLGDHANACIRLNQQPGTLARLLFKRHRRIADMQRFANAQFHMQFALAHGCTFTVWGVSSRVMRRMSESGRGPK